MVMKSRVTTEATACGIPDSSFKPIPANISILSGREVPPFGGETEFANARYAYDTCIRSISGVEKDLEGLICEHSIIFLGS